MDLTSSYNEFLLWGQTPLGTAIVAPLAVAAVTGTVVAVFRFIRSVPRRFERWLERREARL